MLTTLAAWKFWVCRADPAPEEGGQKGDRGPTSLLPLEPMGYEVTCEKPPLWASVSSHMSKSMGLGDASRKTIHDPSTEATMQTVRNNSSLSPPHASAVKMKPKPSVKGWVSQLDTMRMICIQNVKFSKFQGPPQMERTVSTGRCLGSLNKNIFERGWLLITQVGKCWGSEIQSWWCRICRSKAHSSWAWAQGKHLVLYHPYHLDARNLD